MKALTMAFLLALVSTGALAQVYKCKDAQGRIELSDTACGAGSSGEQVMARPTAPAKSTGQVQDERELAQLQDAQASLECDAARETLSHRNSAANQKLMRQACGLPEPTPRPSVRTRCSTLSQDVAGGIAVGSARCVTR